MENAPAEHMDLGTWLGRGQAFGVLASKCSGAQAECLRKIRDAASYKLLGLTWEEFCSHYVGLTRPRVDALIHSLEEFGQTYFQLSELIRVSPEAYRQIAPKIQNDQIEIDGVMVPLIPENTARIRSAVIRMRADLQKARKELVAAASPSIANLQTRLDVCFEEMRRKLPDLQMRGEEAWMRGLVNYSMNNLKKIAGLFNEK